MKIACCQFDIAWEDKPANYQRVENLLRSASLAAGSLVLLPEMFATGFSMNASTIAEKPGGPTQQFLARISQELKLNLLAGLVRRDAGGKIGNDAILLDPHGKVSARFRKLHPFSFAGEHQHYASGEKVITFRWNGFVVSPFICYDLRFPEPFRLATRRGANLLVVLANWPTTRQTPWITLLQARAIENQAYVAGVNRCGNDPNANYSGQSLIIDPRGNIIAQGGTETVVVSAELDLGSLVAFREKFPALRDARASYG